MQLGPPTPKLTLMICSEYQPITASRHFAQPKRRPRGALQLLALFILQMQRTCVSLGIFRASLGRSATSSLPPGSRRRGRGRRVGDLNLKNYPWVALAHPSVARLQIKTHMTVLFSEHPSLFARQTLKVDSKDKCSRSLNLFGL